MNKRLFAIYTIVFLLIGVMLYLYRSSYKDMKAYIGHVNSVSDEIIKLERLQALLHFWLNNDPSKNTDLDLYMPSDVAYDSIIHTADALSLVASYQEQRLRLDTLKRRVKVYQSIVERKDPTLTEEQAEIYRMQISQLTKRAFSFSRTQLEAKREMLEQSTALLDKWLVWMLVCAGSLITLATFYSFTFLQQRKRAEGFSSTMLQTTNNGIVSFEPMKDVNDFIVTYCNDAARGLLNLRDWKGKRLSDIIPASIHEDIFNAFYEVLESRNTKRLEGYIEQGQERSWLEVTIAPLEEGVLASIYDLNPVKSYEQKLTYKIKQLEVANEELQQYAYITSHDLQEPLRKIQMFSDMGMNLKDNGEKSKNDFFGKIINAASHMRELIQTLLMFTRSTDKPEAFSLVDLQIVVSEVLKQLEESITQVQGIVKVGQLPPIQGSVVHLSLLFNNLLTNSIKYSRPGVPLEVNIREDVVHSHDYQQFVALDQRLKYTKIVVADNGLGFPEKFGDKIFTIFQRLHSKTDIPGTGIGLAICKKIVHLHHGFIYAEGKEDDGATFYIFLPLEQPQTFE